MFLQIFIGLSLFDSDDRWDNRQLKPGTSHFDSLSGHPCRIFRFMKNFWTITMLPLLMLLYLLQQSKISSSGSIYLLKNSEDNVMIEQLPWAVHNLALQCRHLTLSLEQCTFTAIYGHALNLAVADTLKQSKLMKDSLEITGEITKLIKYCPRRDGICQRLKETFLMGSTPGIRMLCPTRWTVCAESINSIIANAKPWRRLGRKLSK